MVANAPKSAEAGTSQRKRRRALAAGAIVLFLICASVGGAIYQQRYAPFRTTVLIVNDTSIQMAYLLKRILMLREDPLSVLRALTFEEIVKQVAPASPYNIAVSDSDIDGHLRDMAGGRSGSISDAEFTEWYRQQLNESRLSDEEFRDLARTRLLSLHLKIYLNEHMPTVAEQLHLHAITQRSVEDALAVKARLDTGEEFTKLARDLSTDKALKANGGDLGWYPRGILAPNLDRLAFDNLQIGDYSNPVKFGDQQIAIFMVSERVAARKVDADALAVMKDGLLDKWFAAEFERHTVAYHGFKNGYDSETEAWIKQQVKAMEQSPGGRQ